MFELARSTPFEEYNGIADFYVHDGTGMEVFHIRNNDTECCCSFMFSTPSEDSKGVAHILEHTVLCGSGRFPVKDPFSQVLLSSPNTFLNAMTFVDKTMYPFASPLKKDFDILFDIYADAVFNPLLRRESFMQEGIRSLDGHFDGVVFNEMCGARSTEDSVVQGCIYRDLYKGTPCQYDSGGDPLHIVELTYEEYLERYRRWYSPSNCRLFLWGDLDASEYLEKLEKRYLAGCPRGEKIIPKSENYLQKDMKPSRSEAKCPSGDARSVVLSWLTAPGDDSLEILTASVLVDMLLGNPGAPLYNAIIESDLGEDLHPLSGTDVECPVLTFSVGFSHAAKGKEDEIEAFFLDQIASYVSNGLPDDVVEAAIRRLEFKEQEIPGDGVPFGILTCMKAARCWLRGKDPEAGVSGMERLRRLKERVAHGRYFESWMKENLLDNPRRCLLTVESDDGYDELFKARLSEKLAAMPAACAEEKEKFERFVNEPDSDEALASIERITVNDLPRRINRYVNTCTRLESGARYYEYSLFTRGIVYLSIAFDTRNLDLEEKRMLPLLVRAMQMCGTEKHDFRQVSTMIKMLTGSFFMYPNAGTDAKRRPLSAVIVRSKMLARDFAPAMDLIGELLTQPDLSDTMRIKASLTDMITEFESGYTYSANSYAVLSASSVFSASAMESELNVGTSLWLYLVDLRRNLESGKTSLESLSASLTKLWKKVFTQRAMKIHTGSDCQAGSLVQVVSAFTDRFRVGKFVRTSHYYGSPAPCGDSGRGDTEHPVVYTVPSGPAFNAMAVKLCKDDEQSLVASTLLSSVLSSGYLWSVVRGANGAYGVESHVDRMEGLFVFSSYRDPRISETFRVYLDSLCQNVGKQEIDYAVVTILGRELRPLSPQTRSSEAFNRVISGSTYRRYLRRRRLLLQMTPEDLSRVSEMIAESSRTGQSCVVVCGCDMAGGGTEKLKPLRLTALPI